MEGRKKGNLAPRVLFLYNHNDNNINNMKNGLGSLITNMGMKMYEKDMKIFTNVRIMSWRARDKGGAPEKFIGLGALITKMGMKGYEKSMKISEVM